MQIDQELTKLWPWLGCTLFDSQCTYTGTPNRHTGTPTNMTGTPVNFTADYVKLNEARPILFVKKYSLKTLVCWYYMIHIDSNIDRHCHVLPK